MEGTATIIEYNNNKNWSNDYG